MAADKPVCALWAGIAPTLLSDAEGRQNASLYTDAGLSSDSAPQGPFQKAMKDASFGDQPLADGLTNVTSTIQAGDGSDASFQADISAVDHMTNLCANY